MKLTKFMERTYKITCSGLRIGGTKGDIDPGGMDDPIIRSPITELPYIPGSSLKGKIRSLLELSGIYTPYPSQTGRPCGCAQCLICTVFGAHAVVAGKQITRILFRDARLTPESVKILKNLEEDKGLNFAEVKSENWIDRKNGLAGHGGLRTWERIPEGTQFVAKIVLKIFDCDTEQEIIGLLEKGIGLLEHDYLGSSGSRGYGEVTFEQIAENQYPVN